MEHVMNRNGGLISHELNPSYESYGVAVSNELTIKISFEKYHSCYVNNRFCHSHWKVIDESDGVEVNHASWYYDDELNSVVILNTVPNHYYRVLYTDIYA